MSSDAASDVYDSDDADWHRRVVGRSLQDAQKRSIDRGARLVRAAAKVLERTNGESLTVQEVADEAGQSLRTLYQYFASKDDLLLAVYEEAMRTYARMIRAAVADLEDPVERLAGGIIASARMAALHNKAGVDRALSRLRLQLGQAEPELLARSQLPVTLVYKELVAAALASASQGGTAPNGLSIDHSTYFVTATRTAFVLSIALGNEYALELPDVIELSMFCMGGLGLERPRTWHEDIDAKLALSGGDGRSILRRLAKSP